MKIDKILKYQGNDKYINCLVVDEDGKFYVLFARTSNIEISSEINSFDYFGFDDRKLDHLTLSTNYTFSTKLIPNNNGVAFTLMNINKEEDYDLINKVLGAIL